MEHLCIVKRDTSIVGFAYWETGNVLPPPQLIPGSMYKALHRMYGNRAWVELQIETLRLPNLHS